MMQSSQAGDDSKSLTALFTKLLVRAGASRRSADILVALRGLGGEPPRSLRSVAGGELSAERIRQLVGELERGALLALIADKSEPVADLKTSLARVLRRVEAHAPGSDEDIKAALAADFEPMQTSPASVVRMADILGVHHSLRLTTWTARAKFEDDSKVTLAAPGEGNHRESVCGIVPDDMPEIFENFINFARRFSRGAGVVAAGQLAARYGVDRGIPLAPNESAAFLRPFAVHLGRHDGDEWFAFFNSANDFIRKVTTRVEIFGECSFEHLRQFHQKFNRSLYADESMAIPESVLRAALELAGFHVDGDIVRPINVISGQAGRGISDIQAQMVRVFRETLAGAGGRKSVKRTEFVAALQAAGIRESTARMYLGNQGLFVCSGGLCRLANSSAGDGDEAPSVGRRSRGAGSRKRSAKAAPAAQTSAG